MKLELVTLGLPGLRNRGRLAPPLLPASSPYPQTGYTFWVYHILKHEGSMSGSVVPPTSWSDQWVRPTELANDAVNSQHELINPGLETQLSTSMGQL